MNDEGPALSMSGGLGRVDVLAVREDVCTARQHPWRCGDSTQRRAVARIQSLGGGARNWDKGDSMKPIGVVAAAAVLGVVLCGCTTLGRKPMTRAGACSLDSECQGGSCQAGSCSQMAATDQATCAFDSQCPGGSCRFGECSPLPPANPSCSFDSQCPGGSCRFGECSPFPPANPSCSFDSQCLGGSCQFGTCSQFPRTTATCIGLECP